MPRIWWPFTSLPMKGTDGVATDAPRPPHLSMFLAAVVLALGIWAALAFWLPGERGVLEVGRPSPVSIQSPQTVEFVSDLLTGEARSQAENRPENIVYAVNNDQPGQQRGQLSDLFATITSIRNDPSLSSVEKREKLIGLPSASMVISDTLAEAILSLDDGAWNTVRTRTFDLYDRAMEEYQFEIDEAAIQQLRERSLPFWASGLPKLQRDLVLLFTTSYLRVNRTLDREATEQRKLEARAMVEPVTIRVQAGESIVRVGEIVRPETIEKLQAVGELPTPITGIDLVGLAAVCALLAGGTMLSILYLQPDPITEARPLFVIVGLLIATVFGARLLLPLWSNYPYVFPMVTTVLVLAIVFNSYLAFASAVFLSIVVGMLGDNSLALTTTMLVGSVVGIFAVRGAEKPARFLLVGGAIALAAGATELGFWIMDTTELRWTSALNVLLFSATSGILSAILALGLFNLVGHLAGVVTPLQLMELAHPSQPLLRKLMREAPGTYYHSIAVSNLSEAAAEAVGADALLLRVSAYYHDIGKTIRPYFFTDNQTGRENVHNDLDPTTSAAIIIDHVREGVKMAKAAGLPQQIIDFISTHHGTQPVGHFYQLALREQDSVNIEDFRYPGPKPFTREQGIMMLADSVEATVRSKAQHGQLRPGRSNANGSNGHITGSGQTIDELVSSIIEERMRSGQLDNTSLTLRDLALIRQAFVNSLQGIYHPRVDYAPPMMKVS